MDPHPQARPPHAVAAGLCWLALAPLLVLAGARVVRLDDRIPLLFAVQVLTLYVYLPVWIVLAVSFALRGRRALRRVAAVVACAHVVWIAPYVPLQSSGPSGGGRPFTLVTANVLAGNDHPGALDGVAAEEPDVLVVLELTPAMARRIEDDVRFDRLVAAKVEAREGTMGIGVYSRFPLADAETVELGGTPAIRTRVVAGSREAAPITLLAVHTIQPLADLHALKAALDGIPALVPAPDRPAIVAGDLNVTSQHRPFRRMLDRTGYRDAHASSGRSLASTWPVGGRLPPLALLDHVVVSDVVHVHRVVEVDVPGSDHRAVAATVSATELFEL